MRTKWDGAGGREPDTGPHLPPPRSPSPGRRPRMAAVWTTCPACGLRRLDVPGRSAPSAPSSVKTSKPVGQAVTPAPRHLAQSRAPGDAERGLCPPSSPAMPKELNPMPPMLTGSLALLPPLLSVKWGAQENAAALAIGWELPSPSSPPSQAMTVQLTCGRGNRGWRQRAARRLPASPPALPQAGVSCGAHGEPAPLAPQTRLSGCEPPATWEPEAPPSRPGPSTRGSCLDLAHICSSFHAPRAPRFLRLQHEAGALGRPAAGAAGLDVTRAGRRGQGGGSGAGGRAAVPTSRGASVSRLQAQPSRAPGSLHAACPGARGRGAELGLCPPPFPGRRMPAACGPRCPVGQGWELAPSAVRERPEPARSVTWRL